MPETTPLAFRDQIVRWGRLVTATGIIGGAVFGAWGLSNALGNEVTWPGLMLGAISCSVLGGWLAFMAYSFGSIARHAWRHAKADEQKPSRH